MPNSLRDSVFYVLIVGDDRTDHVFLRKVMNKLVPQAIVESLYNNYEAISFFQKHNAVPNVIFLDQHALTINGNAIMPLIRNNEDLEQVPVIILAEQNEDFTKTDSLKTGANELYTKPYHHKKFETVVTEIRDKWFVSILNQKNLS